MNGAESRIEIFKPFGEAFELTKVILFQPFDLRKWCVLGFAAFMSHLAGGGGGGINIPDMNRHGTKEVTDNMREAFAGVTADPLIVAVICAIGLIIFAIVIVCWWLAARGHFIFTDCVVRNRAAIVEPWHEYKREGNSYFFFILATTFAILVIGAVLALPIVLPLIRGSEPDFAFWITLLILGAIFFVFLIGFALLAQFIVPLMYRRRFGVWQGLRESIALVSNHPGPIILYALFVIVLYIGAATVSCLAMCATCCLAALPYVGTVILLPVFVFLLAFKLLFLRQFGPEYDVWAGRAQSEPPSSEAPPPLPT